MNKLTIAILAVLLATPVLSVAGANESTADCEKSVTWTDENGRENTGPQPWTGYKQTDAARTFFYEATSGTPLYFNNCEGEHWDGQDAASGDYHASPSPCEQVDPSVPDPEHARVDSCMGADPNDGTSNPLENVGNPVRLRATSVRTQGNEQVYLGAQIGAVGWAVIYLGHCDGSGAGLEGAASCEGTNQLRQAVYVRDDTPGDVLATAVSAPGITKGHVSQADCDEGTYMSGAEQGSREYCGRDNTAITLEEILS